MTPDYVDRGRPHSLQLHEIPDGVAIYRIHGPFLFGSTDKLLDLEPQIADLPTVVVLRLRNMTAIDGTGLHALERSRRRAARRAAGRCCSAACATSRRG